VEKEKRKKRGPSSGHTTKLEQSITLDIYGQDTVTKSHTNHRYLRKIDFSQPISSKISTSTGALVVAHAVTKPKQGKQAARIKQAARASRLPGQAGCQGKQAVGACRLSGQAGWVDRFACFIDI
jgi:hypothetical protein